MAAARPFRPALLAGLALAAALASNAWGEGLGVDQAAARVDGQVVWASEVRREAVVQGLIAPAAPLDPSSALFHRLLDQVIDRKLLAAEAVREGLDRPAATERELADRLVARVAARAASEDAIQKLYEEQLRLAGPSERPTPLAQARPQIVRFLTYDRIRDLLATLRSRAHVETLVITKPAGATPRAPHNQGAPA